MKTIFFLLFLSIIACNPVKQVLKSPDKTQKVVDGYLKIHPFVNDTTEHFTPGDTTTEIINDVDTAYTYGYSDTAFGHTLIINPGLSVWRYGGDSLIWGGTTHGLYLDTVPCKTKTILRTQTITKTIHDTLKVKIVDKSFSDELQRQNNVKAQTINDLTANLKTETAAHRKWILFFWLLIAAIVGYATKGIWAPGLSKILTLLK